MKPHNIILTAVLLPIGTLLGLMTYRTTFLHLPEDYQIQASPGSSVDPWPVTGLSVVVDTTGNLTMTAGTSLRERNFKDLSEAMPFIATLPPKVQHGVIISTRKIKGKWLCHVEYPRFWLPKSTK